MKSLVNRGNSEVGFIFYVRYLDHVLFKNTDSDLCSPLARETVGWLARENDDAIWIVWDRSVERVSNLAIRPCESGLVVLKSGLLEMKKIE